MTLEESDKTTQRSIKALNEFGVPANIKSLCVDAIQFENEVTAATLRMQDKLRQLQPARDTITTSLDTLRQTIENMMNNFKEWSRTLDSLISTALTLPPLSAEHLRLKEIRAPCSLQTKELIIVENETLKIIDASQANCVQVRKIDGKEGFVPILSFVLPSSDKSISALMQRLQIQLLGSWTECLRHFHKQLLQSTNVCLESLNLKCKKLSPDTASVGGATNDVMQVVQQIVSQLEKDFLGRQDKFPKSKVDNASSLSKTFHCYQEFEQMCHNFRSVLEGKKPRPICIFENLADFKQQVMPSKQLRYYKTKFVVESTETREEITHLPSLLERETMSGGSYNQTVEAEHLVSSSKEVKQRIVIRSVRDPRDDKNISMDEAIKLNILDMGRGLYMNPDTGASKPIAAAMSEGLIKVEKVTETVSEQKSEALGLITIRDKVEDRRQYKVLAVTDALTAEKLDLDEATKRGLLSNGTFVISTTGQRIPMDEAIDSGWIQVEYEDLERSIKDVVFDVKTYAVRTVVDQRLKKPVSFMEAVHRGLIEKDTGNYVNNATGEKVYVVDAIKRGFLKATLVDDASKLDIDPNNRVVVERIGKVKRLVTGMGVLSAMKQAASASNTPSPVL